MKRGVVASPMQVERTSNGGFMTVGGLSPTDLNYYTLYWDKTVIPGSREIYFQLHNEELLIKLGIIERPRVSVGVNSDLYPVEFPKQQVRIFDELQSDHGSDYVWVLHQIGGDFSLPDGIKERKRVLRLELINALPIPDENVNPEQVLEFKNRYQDEYKAFHEYLDELYQNVAYAPDEPLFQKKAYESFRNSIDDINKLSGIKKDWFFQRYNIKFNMPTKNELIDVVLGAMVAVADTSNPYVTGLGLMQTANGFVKLNDKYEDLIKGYDKTKNLLYLASAYKEGVL